MPKVKSPTYRKHPDLCSIGFASRIRERSSDSVHGLLFVGLLVSRNTTQTAFLEYAYVYMGLPVKPSDRLGGLKFRVVNDWKRPAQDLAVCLPRQCKYAHNTIVRVAQFPHAGKFY